MKVKNESSKLHRPSVPPQSSDASARAGTARPVVPQVRSHATRPASLDVIEAKTIRAEPKLPATTPPEDVAPAEYAYFKGAAFIHDAQRAGLTRKEAIQRWVAYHQEKLIGRRRDGLVALASSVCLGGIAQQLIAKAASYPELTLVLGPLAAAACFVTLLMALDARSDAKRHQETIRSPELLTLAQCRRFDSSLAETVQTLAVIEAHYRK